MFNLFERGVWYLSAMDAQDAQKVIDVLEDWFQAVEKDEANSRIPDTNYKRFTKKECDELINMIDDYINEQIRRGWMRGEVDAGSDFYRISSDSAREAMAQDLYRVCESIAPQVKANVDMSVKRELEESSSQPPYNYGEF